jgi:hypothetical protein
MFPKRLFLAFLGCAVVVPAVAHPETVVARRRMGNDVEGLTYDAQNDRAYAIDGNDVIAIALNPFDAAVLATMNVQDTGIAGLGYRKVFDVLGLDARARVPRGIVYVPAQKRFYFSSIQSSNATVLFSSDDEGRPQPTLNLKGLGDVSGWGGWEGLAWIPKNAPVHGGTIAAVGHRADYLAHVYFIRLDGTVEAEVIPEPGTPLENYFCGIQYWPKNPGTVLLSDCNTSGTYAMDMRNGALVGDPVKPLATPPDGVDVEGIVVRKNGQILESGYQTGRLYAFDSQFHRTPGEDRLFVVGIGASIGRLAWNSDTAELIAVTRTGDQVLAISPDLRSARGLFDVDVNHELPSPSGVAYLGSGQLAVANRFYPRGIDIADLTPGTAGYSLSRLLFFEPSFPAGQPFQPLGMGPYGPNAFLVNVQGDRTALKVVTRTGVADAGTYPDGVLPSPLPDVVLSVPTNGLEAQVFDPGTGPRIFTGAEIYDASGTLLHVIDSAKLGATNPPLRQGVWMFGNTFAAEDGDTSTIIIYTVP